MSITEPRPHSPAPRWFPEAASRSRLRIPVCKRGLGGWHCEVRRKRSPQPRPRFPQIFPKPHLPGPPGPPRPRHTPRRDRAVPARPADPCAPSSTGEPTCAGRRCQDVRLRPPPSPSVARAALCRVRCGDEALRSLQAWRGSCVCCQQVSVSVQVCVRACVWRMWTGSSH